MPETPQGLRKLVNGYFEFRNYTEPTTDQAFKFFAAELGELADALVQSEANWVRNNPEDKSGDLQAIKAEIGDCLMMLTKLADTLDIDPLTAMIEKFQSKGWRTE
jgi:NTP pyrophosphatase (non-canonical NTP hydrolase)